MEKWVKKFEEFTFWQKAKVLAIETYKEFRNCKEIK